MPVTNLGEPLYLDTGLTEGAFYYYSIFVRHMVGAVSAWVRSADTFGLVVRDFGYSGLLHDRLPSIFTTSPASTAVDFADDAPTPVLTRFLSIFGFQLDNARTTFDSLLDTKNADRVGSQLLGLLARELGQNYEPEIGQRQNRVLLRNSVYLYKTKGTTTVVPALASALAGWGADILPTTNLLLDADDASAETGIGRWHVRSGPGVLDRRASDALVNPAVIPPGAVVGYRNATNSNPSDGMFRLTESGTGGVVLALVQAGVEGDAVRHGIPIDPTKPVLASVFLRDIGTSRVPTLSVDFYDRRGGLLAAPAGSSASAGATASDWSRRQTYYLPAANVPAAAHYIGLTLTYPATANGEVQLFDAVQVEQADAATSYATARVLRLSLHPNRVNLIANPSAEVDYASWTAGASTTLTRSTLQAAAGTASFRLVPSGGGVQASMSTAYAGAAETTYTHSAYVYGPAGSYALTAGSGASSVTSSTVVPDSTWTRISVQRTSSTGEVSTPLVVTGPAGATFYVDEVLAERGVALLPYFDGAVPTADVGWTGTAHESTSVLYTQRAVRDSRLRANIGRYVPLGTRYELVYDDGYKPS